MSTHRSTWKRRERDAARLFGAERQPLSGSAGRADRSRSDSTHDRLFVETKLRASSSVRTLWDETNRRARLEGKTPLLVLFAKGKPGGLVVCHEADLAELADALAVARGDRPAPGLDGPTLAGNEQDRAEGEAR